MIVEIGGGKGGLKEYLEHGRKKGRNLHRDQLDQRIPLWGDLEAFEQATSIFAADGDQYDHITLSFSEAHVSDEMLQRAVDEFRDHVLHAWSDEERHRIAFYAEAHRPRTLSYVNSETGERVERLTHIHIGIGKKDLLTGESVEPMGYLGRASENLKYIDAWQESFNARHGFTSPKDNPKISPENAIDVLARYTGQKPDALGTFNGRKSALELALQKEILVRGITTWDGFGQLLSEYGQVSKIRAGTFTEAYRVLPSGSGRSIRLQGVFFQRQFIERPTREKISIILDKARKAYLEQMQPRKAPEYVARLLDEWRRLKAREHRYLHTGSKFYQEVYKPADDVSRQKLLNEIERSYRGVKSSSDDLSRKITSTRNRVPKMPVRNLDGIQRRSEMLLSGDDGMDVRTGVSERSVGVVLRSTDGDDGGEQRLIQPSSVLARLAFELRERYDIASQKDRFAEIRKNLDCRRLLVKLSHSHGIDTERYSIQRATDGSPRIKCGSRLLTPNDLLTKELGLPWKESAPILRQVYEQQIGKLMMRPKRLGRDAQLWAEFKEGFRKEREKVPDLLRVFDAETKVKRSELALHLKSGLQRALLGLSGPEKKAALSVSKLHAARVKAEFNEERRTERKSIYPDQHEAWKLFLHDKAQEGSEPAISALRQLTDQSRSIPQQAISGTIFLEGDSIDQSLSLSRRIRPLVVLRELVHQVEWNGDVTYRRNGMAVLRDEGTYLAVLDEGSDSAILAGLLIAREKFGEQLNLTGSQEFQMRVVAIAVAQGLTVKFIDPALEQFREQLVAERSFKEPQRTETLDQLSPHKEASTQREAEMPADRQHGLDAEVLRLRDQVEQLGLRLEDLSDEKTYIGNVLSVTDNYVLQKVTRSSAVIHKRSELQGEFIEDVSAEIEYRNGKGVERSKSQRHDPGHER